MKFVLEIKMDNAAFKDEYGDGLDAETGASEVSRILNQARTQIQNAGALEDRSSGTLVDINGNLVGSWSVTS